jgi:hypothetical protein
MSDDPVPNSEIILYQTEDGRTRIQYRLENETLWPTQKLMDRLFPNRRRHPSRAHPKQGSSIFSICAQKSRANLSG